jgi:hypothetical protein
VRGAKRRRQQDTVTDTEGRNTRRLGNRKYLIVQKRELEGEWGSFGSRRGEGRCSCKKQRLWVF